MEAQTTAPAEFKALASWLRNKSGMKTRLGALGGKRVDYFKGRSSVKALLSPAYAKAATKAKNLPPAPADDTAAVALLHSLIPHTFFLRVERGHSVGGKDGPKLVQITQQQLFTPDEYYVWLLDANPIRQMLMAGGMVLVVLAAVMFPLWPASLRIGVWYLSIGVLGLIGLFFAIAIVRLILWVITIVVAKPGIWIFPNLFADVGFVDSFIPLWGWDIPPPKKVRSKRKEKKEKAPSGSSSALDHGHSHDGAGHDHSHSHTDAGPRIVELVDGEDEE